MSLLSGSFYVDASGVSEAPAATAFSYDAVEARGRRKTPSTRTQSEDRILDAGKRSKLQANATDLHRNFAICQWMIRRHLDYVATFRFHGRTENEAVNDRLEFLMGKWSRPYNCDASGRHRFAKMIRLSELLAVLHGDVGFLKLANGQLQGIESDRIRNPVGLSTASDDWLHGVRVAGSGRAQAYAIHRRLNYGGFELERIVPASNLCLHGYFDRFDQVRGISPIASALNPMRDVYENFDLALAKAKVEQLFALVLQREALDGTGDTTETTTTDEDGTQRTQYEVDFGRGPVKLELDPGDKAEFLESKHPSANFQAFSQLVLTVGLKALDIPYSFYDESHTNFFGSRGAWLHYERASQDKRETLQELLDRITLWRTILWVVDGDLELPQGMTVGDIAWEWVPMGMPWWDPVKEINGDVLAIGAGLDNPQRITKERGRGDWYENIDEIARAMKYAEKMGVPVSFAPVPTVVEVVEKEEPANGKK